MLAKHKRHVAGAGAPSSLLPHGARSGGAEVKAAALAPPASAGVLALSALAGLLLFSLLSSWMPPADILAPAAARLEAAASAAAARSAGVPAAAAGTAGAAAAAGAAAPAPASALHPYALQCGQDFTAGMPRGTLYSPSTAAADAAAPGAGACASLAALEAALAGATRGAPPVPWAARRAGDGQDDGELALPGCQLRWVTPAAACALLARAGGLVLVGDSLVRHTELALRQLASGNWAVGGLLGGDLPADGTDRWAACRCDLGYGAFWACHALPSDAAAPGRFAATCPHWPPQAPQPLTYLPFWGEGGWNDTAVRRALGAYSGSGGGSAPALLVVEVGPAWHEQWLPGQPDIAAQLAAAAAAASDARAKLVCMLALAPDEARKPDFARSAQSLAATVAVNAYVARQCRSLGGVVLDAFALSRGAWSRDGTHYEGKVMGVVAQALLNLAEAAAGEAALLVEGAGGSRE